MPCVANVEMASDAGGTSRGVVPCETCDDKPNEGLSAASGTVSCVAYLEIANDGKGIERGAVPCETCAAKPKRGLGANSGCVSCSASADMCKEGRGASCGSVCCAEMDDRLLAFVDEGDVHGSVIVPESTMAGPDNIAAWRGDLPNVDFLKASGDESRERTL